MAFYYVDLSKGIKGNSAIRCDYITRTGKASGYKDLIAKGTINLPPWAKDGRDFFEKADLFERKNGSTFKQIIFALPNELSIDDNKKIVKEVLDKILGDTKVGVWAIHSVQAKFENTTNIHAHIMFSERIIDRKIPVKPPNIFFKRYTPNAPENKRGYLKDNTYTHIGKGATQAIKQLRNDIEEIINNAYERAGLDIRISCKTLKEQKEEAIKNKDYDKASMLNRKPIEDIPLKKWLKIKSIAKQLNAFDFDNPIPLMPNKTNQNFFDTLLDEDIDATEMLIKKLEGYKVKFQLESNYKISQGLKALEKIKKQNHKNISTKDFYDIISSLDSQIQKEIRKNENKILLHQRLFKDEKSVMKIISNIITRGKYRRYLKIQQKLKAIKIEREKLQEQNKLTSIEEEKYRLIIQDIEETKGKLKNQILKINQQKDFNKRYLKLNERLKNYYPRSIQRAKKAFEENQKLEKIEEITGSLLSKAASNPELKITSRDIQNLQVQTRNELKLQLENLNKKLQRQYCGDNDIQTDFRRDKQQRKTEHER